MGGVRFVILCEDSDHKRFAEHFLKACGAHPRDLRSRVAPASRGDASRWVIQQYPNEVKIHRRKSANQDVALLIVIDGDNHSVSGRLREIDDGLDQAEQASRSGTERVCVWIPCRNIETWVYYLGGNSADETSNYRNAVRADEYRAAAEEFLRRFRAQAHDAVSLNAMVRAFSETKRIID